MACYCRPFFRPGATHANHTPTASGTFAITLQATDAHAQTGTRAYVLRIDPATLSLSPASVANGVLGSAYGQVFTASGGVAP